LSVEMLFLAKQYGEAGSDDPTGARPEGDRLVTLTCHAGGLPFLVKRWEALLTRCGADLSGRYGAFPDVGSPTILYQLGGPAAAYAEARLLPAAAPGPASLLLAALSRWAGCDTSLGSVIVIGRKP
jgi:hypothetical protein